MLLPLIFGGAGKLSLDHLLARGIGAPALRPQADGFATALTAAVLGLPFLMLIPALGLALLGVAAVLAATAGLRRRHG
ncbi:hypothetical protein ACFJIW_21295 [Tahibacter sp. UC22_41]|uniref:hypothetical protein n=1 Tax=Tahibacter sp. UC22_41 TaxID=3350178 RepID=UPI0036DA0440